MSGWFIDIGAFVLGVVLLIIGGDTLVRGAVALASRFGVPAFIIGLTVLAFGTSAPELALNIAAAINENSDLSFGNIVGSNIANIGLIMGVSALCKPMAVHASIIRRELPIMVLATGALIALFYLPPRLQTTGEHGLSRIDAVVLLGGFALFCLMLVRSTKNETSLGHQIPSELRSVVESGGTKTGVAVLLTLLGLFALAVGGRFTEMGAVAIAERVGMSDELIGLTIVAVATSLPELAASLAAALRGHSDLAVGNIVGSNIFNILLVLGVTGLVSPVALPVEGGPALVAVAIFSVALLPISRTHDNKVSRLEGGVLLASYAGFMAWQAYRALNA
jgi:cation:H+ antiporter